MAEPQLSVRSAKARDLARRLARRENRSIVDVVERALKSYEIREAGREPAASFYSRLSGQYGTDLGLEAVIKESWRAIKESTFDLFGIRYHVRSAEEGSERSGHRLAGPVRCRACASSGDDRGDRFWYPENTDQTSVPSDWNGDCPTGVAASPIDLRADRGSREGLR